MNQTIIGTILLNQFQVKGFVAAGGMGAVYRVWDLRRNVPLAMKVLHAELADDPTEYRRFQREALALERLAHPNIVPFYGLYKTTEFVFLLERYIDGPSLKQLLARNKGKPMPVINALACLKSVASALGYAHAGGVVHCDVKPGNIMLDRSGNIFLTDFGIARHAESTTTSLVGIGTPAYMAPEQIRGLPVTAQTDVYALAVILFEMLTGRRPFTGAEIASESSSESLNERVRSQHLQLPPPDPRSINPDIPEGLARAILTGLAKQPGQRYGSTQEFFQAACLGANINHDQVPTNLSTYTANFKPETLPARIPNLKTQSNQKAIALMVMMFGLVLTLSIILLMMVSNRFQTGLPIAANISFQSTLPQQPNNKDGAAQPEDFFPLTLTAAEFATASPYPTYTPFPTLTPFPTYTSPPPTDPPPTKDPLHYYCPGSIGSRLKANMQAYVCTNSKQVIVYNLMGEQLQEMFRLAPGTEVLVVDGPNCWKDSTWWKITIKQGVWIYAHGNGLNVQNDTDAWAMENGNDTDPYFLCPR